MERSRRVEPFEQILKQPGVSLSFPRDPNSEYAVGRIDTSPCRLACPAGVNTKAYISLIAAGRFREALEVVRETNPFPGICGRVCVHPCESFCNRAQVDEPVAICRLKRFVADYELQHPQEPAGPLPVTQKEKVAIIGSGPAGLTAANDLIRKGYAVTVFEAMPKAGGMLTAGIPSFRLPRPIIEYEIDIIKKLGVEIKTGKKISGRRAIDKLFETGYDAVFIAIGAHKGKKLEIAGEDKYEGTLDASSFLYQVNLGRAPKLANRVAIIGGGNSALDAARSAVRLGSKAVTIVYRRSRKEMPANEWEIEDAESEGVKIQYLTAPVEILGRNGKVTGMKCTRISLGEPDESGRRRPIPVQASEFTFKAGNIIAAISQEPDLSFLPKKHEFDISKWRTFNVDESTLATSRPGVFAGGDAVTGPNTVIDAIASGHVAAQSIENYLNSQSLQQASDSKAAAKTSSPGSLDQLTLDSSSTTDLRATSLNGSGRRPDEFEIKVDIGQNRKKLRADMPIMSRSARIAGFDEAELGFSETAAVAEAQRCLRCGPCGECFICVSECEKTVSVMASTDGRRDALLRLPPEITTPNLQSWPLDGILNVGRRKPIPVQITPTTCTVEQEICRGCGECVSVCEYSAPMLIPKPNGLHVSIISERICRGCGTCVAVCPSSAIVQQYFSEDWLLGKLQSMDQTKRNVVIFTCNWNGTELVPPDLEAMSQPDANLIFIRTTCCGRIEPSFIFRALEHGADGVLAAGCPTSACHYSFGNRHATEHFSKVRNMLNLLGYSPEKFQWTWPDKNRDDGFIEAIGLHLRNMRDGKSCSEFVDENKTRAVTDA